MPLASTLGLECVRSTLGSMRNHRRSSIDLSTVPAPEDQHNQFIVHDVLNDSVVTGSDAICHESVAELGGHILVGDVFGLLARGRRGTNVGLIFQLLEHAIAELRRYGDCASTSPAGGDHDRLTLWCGDEIGLAVADVGEGYGNHEPMVDLVQEGNMGFGLQGLL